MLVFTLGGSVYFIYNNIYQTIGEIQSIIILKSQISTEVIDFDRLQKVNEKWNIKNNTEIPTLTRDPFNPISTTTIPITETTQNKNTKKIR